jgi:hypothetical protein
MSELDIDRQLEQDDSDIFDEMHYHATMYNIKELCLKHGTDNIINEIKEYLSLGTE